MPATITSVWSSYGHRFMSTDDESHESCLTCGAMYALTADPDDPTRGDYTTAAGEQPQECTHNTSMAHGYPGERVCDACSDIDGCENCAHDCNCLFCA